jgi:protein gp37
VTSIEWTDATWNPVTGCSKVSPGCANCYAETLSLRFGWSKKPWTPENAAENVVLHPERLDKPGTWRKPRMVFVNSMSDLFHELVPDQFIFDVFSVMARESKHTYQVLTKRPERMRDLFAGIATCEHGWLTHNGDNPSSYGGTGIVVPEPWPLPNVWLGTSIENMRWVGRADALRDTAAAVRFISAEPLLGPLVERVG